MQDDIKAAMAGLSESQRDRWAFCARRNKNNTALQQAEKTVEMVTDELSEFLGLDETPIDSNQVQGGGV
ncbi:hypothetical protein P3339_08010 [Microbulbifer sp. MLAF003]|uniref:hypothetical protein n=1 Tax=Microbulbifer sp. MLAF003 TaxID=3032582 RepID=UPI0024AE5611|nr:hypothetical protein [Microbulbifer sp. MLAF003]WHI52692.1 hypothetical protein P3339_08010 [Microbulbifer sp. MLAF003]